MRLNSLNDQSLPIKVLFLGCYSFHLVFWWDFSPLRPSLKFKDALTYHWGKEVKMDI